MGQNLYNSDELFNSNGKIIIGDLINYYQSNNFSKSQLVSTYSSNVDSSLLNWAINFNNIYYIFGNKKENELYKIVNLDINNFVIQAPRSYQYNIKFQYFNDYLFKKKFVIFIVIMDLKLIIVINLRIFQYQI